MTPPAARRHHFPEQKRKVTNWATCDANLRQRGSSTVLLTGPALTAWRTGPRTTRAPRFFAPTGDASAD
jgi:hypothetical protein